MGLGWLRARVAHDAGDLDDPRTTERHARLIREKPFLRRFYDETYRFFLAARTGVPAGTELELGSGGGFFKDYLPQVVTSDVMPVQGLDRTIDARALPYADGTLAAIYLFDAFHHIPDVARFLAEAQRALAPGGRIAMQEPANTLWSRFIYRHFHHEPFEPAAPEWSLPAGGPLSMANGALPWIVFVRDRRRFERDFPALEVVRVRETFPIAYLLSGGLTLPQLVPGRAWEAVRAIEDLAEPLHPWCGMFMRVVIEKRGAPRGSHARRLGFHGASRP